MLRLLKREKQPVTAYVSDGVINDIYAFEPPAPAGFFTFAVVVEAAVAATFLAISTLPISDASRVAIFSAFGGGWIVSVSTLSNVALACILMGASTIAIGGFLQWNTSSHHGNGIN